MDCFFSDISDHLPIFTICFDNINCSSNNNTYLFRGKSIKNIKKFENKIANADLSTIDKSNDPNEAFNAFSNQFSSIYNNCFPLI